MKKIFYLLSFTFLLLQACSKSDSSNDSNLVVSVSDADGNSYEVVNICNQTWTKTNLNVSKYRNGDVIQQVSDPVKWQSLTTGAWCYYANTTSNGTTYGKLYNWYAVTDPRGLAPIGYHIPTDAEWTSLTNCLGGKFIAGGKLKETGTSHWLQPNSNATNSNGFSGLPGGFRNTGSSFQELGYYGNFWSSQGNATFAIPRTLNYNNGSINIIDAYDEADGFSVRCVKD